MMLDCTVVQLIPKLIVGNCSQYPGNTYSQVIYLDSDYFPTTPLDNLFEQVHPGKLTAAYCSKPGVVDPCFNAGMSICLSECLVNYFYLDS